jgi:hypothetical protein
LVLAIFAYLAQFTKDKIIITLLSPGPRNAIDATAMISSGNALIPSINDPIRLVTHLFVDVPRMIPIKVPVRNGIDTPINATPRSR